MSSFTKNWRQMAIGPAVLTVGAVVLLAGISKLAGAPFQVEMFRAFGLPGWPMYVLGSVEVAAAVLLWVPQTRFFGALAICCLMLVADTLHVATGTGLPLVFANSLILAVSFWVASQTGMQLRELPPEQHGPTVGA